MDFMLGVCEKNQIFSQERNWHKKDWSASFSQKLSNLKKTWKMNLTKIPIFPNCKVPNGFFFITFYLFMISQLFVSFSLTRENFGGFLTFDHRKLLLYLFSFWSTLHWIWGIHESQLLHPHLNHSPWSTLSRFHL